MDRAKSHPSFNRFSLKLPAKLLAANGIEDGVHPLARKDIHKVHTTRIGYIDRCDPAKEQRSDERRNERYPSRIFVQGGVRTPDLTREHLKHAV